MQASVILEFNCYEQPPSRVSTLWLVKGHPDWNQVPELGEYELATRIIGPIDSQKCAAAREALVEGLRRFGIDVKQETFADD